MASQPALFIPTISRALVGLLLLIFVLPDASAYVVRRELYLPGMPAIDAECGAQNPGIDCFPGDDASTATSVSGNASMGGYTARASASLSTGQLKIDASGPDYRPLARASWDESLTFFGLAPGSTATVQVTLSLDGTYRDGSFVSFGSYYNSGDYFTSDYDYLSVDYDYLGNGNTVGNGGVGSTDPVSGTVFDLGDSCPQCFNASSGNWTTLGPDVFVGEIDIFGDEPYMTLGMSIVGYGYFNIGDTVNISLLMPEGISYTSLSGEFLSAVVPLPAAGWLIIPGLLAGLGWFRQAAAKNGVPT